MTPTHPPTRIALHQGTLQRIMFKGGWDDKQSKATMMDGVDNATVGVQKGERHR